MEVISFLESVQKGMADNIYNFCKDGKCSQCGNCCSNLLPMSRKEVEVIHRYIRKNHIQECKHLLPTAKQPYDMTCPFLDTGKSCEKCRNNRIDIPKCAECEYRHLVTDQYKKPSIYICTKIWVRINSGCKSSPMSCPKRDIERDCGL